MSKLEKTIDILARSERMEGTANAVPDARALIATTLVFLCLMLSVPMGRPVMLLLDALYPIVAAPLCGESFGRIFMRSLWVLPLVAFIGMFNPILDRTPAFTVGSLTVSEGWLSFAVIILRGLLAMQALLILISSHGFTGICRGLARMGLPAFLTTQLLLVFRYMRVLLEQLLTMRRARESRGYGRTRYPLRFWGEMMGQLFLSTIDRSQRIHRAMLSRCFDGTIPFYQRNQSHWRQQDTLWTVLWTALLIALRIVEPSAYL